MTALPRLSTGAVQQQPYLKATAGGTRILRLADGNEQRYTVAPQRRSWIIDLRLLRDDERTSFLGFAQSEVRAATAFPFTDPADGVTYPNCRIGLAPVEDGLDAIGRTSIHFLITEAG